MFKDTMTTDPGDSPGDEYACECGAKTPIWQPYRYTRRGEILYDKATDCWLCGESFDWDE